MRWLQPENPISIVFRKKTISIVIRNIAHAHKQMNSKRMHQHYFEYILYLFPNKDGINNYLPRSYDDNTIIIVMAHNQ